MSQKNNDNIKEQLAKAWCLGKGISEDQMKEAWERALDDKNVIICNLNKRGYQWWWLPPHLMNELYEHYTGKEKDKNG